MNYNFDGTAVYAISCAREIAENLNFDFVPKELFFSTLYIMPETPMYKYFLSRGVKKRKIEEKRTDLFNQMVSNVEKFKILIFKLGKEEFYIDEEIFNIIVKAGEIAKEQYATNVIGITHLTAAFSELFSDQFMLIMKTFIPNVGERNPEMAYLMEDEGFYLPKEVSSFLTVLNDKYSKDSTECHICGRDEETKMLTKILMKKTKRNAVLVGEAGVGKTALVEKFTWMIVTGNCPEKFKDCIVLGLDVNAIVAGTQYRGSAEERFNSLIKFLEANPNCILFVDEIHLLLGAGACREGDLDLANALKPMLARGETRVIGATTEDEYTKYFSKDSALKRRFEKIIVREPRSYEVYDMIKNQIKLLEKAHGTTISKELVDAVIFKASCFNFETRNPDRTLDLLDKTMVCAELEGRTEVTEADILENFNINQKKFEKMNAENKAATAYHEAGHYIAHRFSKELAEYVMLAVSIIPAEDYLGVNVFEIDSDITPTKNKQYFIELIGSLLAGRIAEKMYSHALTAGACSDLSKATRVARDMVTRYGLDENTENRVFLAESSEHMYNDELITKINSRIDDILSQAREYIEKLLNEKRKYLDALATALIEKGMLSSEEIDELFAKISD